MRETAAPVMIESPVGEPHDHPQTPLDLVACCHTTYSDRSTLSFSRPHLILRFVARVDQCSPLTPTEEMVGTFFSTPLALLQTFLLA